MRFKDFTDEEIVDLEQGLTYCNAFCDVEYRPKLKPLVDEIRDELWARRTRKQNEK